MPDGPLDATGQNRLSAVLLNGAHEEIDDVITTRDFLVTDLATKIATFREGSETVSPLFSAYPFFSLL